MKKITYSFLMLLMAMLALPASMIARETVTFDFAANPWGLPVSNSSDGAAGELGDKSIEQDGVVLTATDGGTNTRLWSSNGAVDFRIYTNGTLTFTAPEGKVIEKIELTTSKLGLSVVTGSFDSSTKTWTQPEEQVSAVTFTVTKTTQITKAVLTIADPGEAEEVVELPTAENIAAFKALDTDTEAELTLTDAKVLYVYGSEMIVEDATGAIDFYSIGLTATAGQVLNGTIAGKNSLYNGLPQLAKTSNTNVETVTVTDGDAPVAVGMTVAEAMAETSFLKYVKITDATLVNEEGTYYLVNGDNKILIYNKFNLEYTLPEAIKSFAGIIIPYVKKGTTDVIVEIAPIAVEDIVEAGTDPDPDPTPALPEAGTYYLKNVATGQFLAAGSSWGSRAIANNVGLDLNFAVLEDDKYTIDTQIDNGGEKHYLDQGLFCDSPVYGWTLSMVKTEAGEDAIMLSDGTNYLTTKTENGSDLQLSADVDDYSKWVLLTVEERLAELQTATADNGKDATWLLPGYNFGRNDKRNNNWNERPAFGGNNVNNCAEKWNATYDISQTINVPNGLYKVEIQGFYRNGGYVAAAAAHNDGTEKLLATAFANAAEIKLQSIFTEAGKLDVGVTTDGIEGKFPNSMSEASEFFSAGLYENVIENVTVVDGTLKVGVKKSEAVENDWTIFDNIRLTYYGEITDLTAYKEAYEAALAAAQAAIADEANAAITGEERTALKEAIAKYGTVEEDKDAYVAATTALNEALNAFTASKAAYQALADAKAKYASFNTNAYPYASEGKASTLREAVTATATTAEDATVKAAAIVTAVRAFVESNALAEDFGAENYTSSIANPNAENSTDSWTTTLGEGSDGSIGILSSQPFTDAEGNSTHSYFDGGNWGASAWDVTFSQDVTLPSGKYLLSVTSRAATDMSIFELFAGEEKTAMTHVGDQGEIFDRGWNDSFVVFNVPADNSTVSLGVHGVAASVHQWMSFTRFRLVRLGNATSGINNVNAETLDNATVYSINGQVVRTNAKSLKGLAKGVYVVNGKKVVVK